MHSRRSFLLQAGFALWTLTLSTRPTAAATLESFRGQEKFKQILARAEADNWKALPIGELMGKIALQFEGTPYKSDTLELSLDKEICSANLDCLDCVTFFETTLCFARMLKHGGKTPTDLLKEIAFTRYRDGKVGDFATRLHYTSDWFADNTAKGVIKPLFDLPGSEPFKQQVNIMSSHPGRQMLTQTALVDKIKQSESAINARSLKFTPLDKVAAIEPLLLTGDIVGICTSRSGLDISHTGLILCTADGVRHFMDASSKPSSMKVTIEPGPIHGAINWSKGLTGLMLARPLEP
jgi:hypothetical protein